MGLKRRMLGILSDLENILLENDDILYISYYLEYLEDFLTLVTDEDGNPLIETTVHGHIEQEVINKIVALEMPKMVGQDIHIELAKTLLKQIKPKLIADAEELLDNFKQNVFWAVESDLKEYPDEKVELTIMGDVASYILDEAATKAGLSIPVVQGCYSATITQDSLKSSNLTMVVLPSYVKEKYLDGAKPSLFQNLRGECE